MVIGVTNVVRAVNLTCSLSPKVLVRFPHETLSNIGLEKYDAWRSIRMKLELSEYLIVVFFNLLQSLLNPQNVIY
jgi:hypothetical protein